jgi:hypothetical protein
VLVCKTEIKVPVENLVQGYELKFKFSPSREVKASTSHANQIFMLFTSFKKLWKPSMAV